MTGDRRSRLAFWAACALIVVWGANFSVQKEVFQALTPAGFLFVRYLGMPVAAALLLVARHGLAWPRLSRADAWALARLGIVGHLLHVGIVSYGIHWSTAFSSSLVLASGPVFTLLLLRWSGLETLRGPQIAGVAVALAGMLVFLADKWAGGDWRAGGGDLVLLFAAALFSWYTVAAKPLSERLGGITVTCYAILFGSLPVVLASWPLVDVDWPTVPLRIWAMTVYATLISAFLGWMVWGWINAVRGVARTAPFMYGMPPVAGLVAWAATGERFSALKVGGAVLVLAGVALAQFGSRTASPAVREAPAPVD